MWRSSDEDEEVINTNLELDQPEEVSQQSLDNGGNAQSPDDVKNGEVEETAHQEQSKRKHICWWCLVHNILWAVSFAFLLNLGVWRTLEC